jgi:hypothetical protein
VFSRHVEIKLAEIGRAQPRKERPARAETTATH